MRDVYEDDAEDDIYIKDVDDDGKAEDNKLLTH